jgi:hypothetical protein
MRSESALCSDSEVCDWLNPPFSRNRVWLLPAHIKPQVRRCSKPPTAKSIPRPSLPPPLLSPPHNPLYTKCVSNTPYFTRLTTSSSYSPRIRSHYSRQSHDCGGLHWRLHSKTVRWEPVLVSSRCLRKQALTHVNCRDDCLT